MEWYSMELFTIKHYINYILLNVHVNAQFKRIFWNLTITLNISSLQKT